MANSSSFDGLVIVNGQPILINDLQPIEIISDTQNLQTNNIHQAIPDVNVPISVSVSTDLNCNNESNNTLHSDNFVMNIVEECNVENAYVDELVGDTSVDGSSTIRLTLEQASQLGLQFTMDSLSENIDLNCTKQDANDKVGDHNQYVSLISNCALSQSDSSECNKPEGCNINENENLMDSFQSVSTSSNQEFTLVPHLVNGTVTYTLHLTNEMLQQSNNSNELIHIDNQQVMPEHTDPANNPLKFDISNLSNATSEGPFISPLGIVPSKINEALVENLTVTSENTGTFETELCNPGNITFLSLSGELPHEVSSHLDSIRPTTCNNLIPESQITQLFSRKVNSNIVKSKNKKNRVQFRESLLLKPKAPVPNDTGLKNIPNTLKNDNLNCGSDNLKKYFPEGRYRGRPTKETEIDVTADNFKSTESYKNLINSRSRSILKKNPEKVDSLVSTEDLFSLNEEKETSNKPSECIDEGNAKSASIVTPSAELSKEVSAALSRCPVKTDAKKPLGSNENPIKLVQQGSNFHSMQALTEDHISRITPILQENFDNTPPSKNVVFDPSRNTRIIYRIISPEEVQLRKKGDSPRRRGRPKKTPSDDLNGALPGKKTFSRTRSGRLSRPPKHMVRDYKHIRRTDIIDSDGGYSDYQSDNDDDATQLVDSAPVDLLPGIERKIHKRNFSAGNLCPSCGKIYLGYERMKTHFDKYPDHGSVEYLNTMHNTNPDSEGEQHNCNGFRRKTDGRKKGRVKSNSLTLEDKRAKLKEMVDVCDAHDVADIAGPTVAGVLSLWQLLMLRVERVKCNSAVEALYSELCVLLTTLRHMAHRLFRPIDHPLPPGQKHVAIQIENEIMTDVLDLPCGIYQASDQDLKDTLTSDPNKTTSAETQLISQSSMKRRRSMSIDEKKIHREDEMNVKKMKIDEGEQPFLEEMICETGLVNVDEIVSERLQNFTSSQSSSVDELMKGLSDMEPRNKLPDDLIDGFSIVSRSPHVSASTEDLIKSLEHFESDLTHSDNPNSLDRDTFDRVTNDDTLDFEVLSREFHSNNS